MKLLDKVRARFRQLREALPENWLEKLKKWRDDFSLLYAFVPTAVVASVTNYLTVVGDLPLWQMFVWMVVTFTSTLIALSVTPPGWRRIGSILVLGVFACGVLLLGCYREFERQRVAYNTYRLDYAEMATDTKATYDVNTGEVFVRGVQIAITFDNNNPFDIWVKSVNRSVTVEHRTSGESQRTRYDRIPAFTKDHRIYDWDIALDPPISARKRMNGTIDFKVCYGRVKGQYVKNYVRKGTLAFMPREDGKIYPPDFTPNEQDQGSYGHGEGC